MTTFVCRFLDKYIFETYCTDPKKTNEYTSKEYQSDDFQTKQRPPQEFPREFTLETTLSGIFRPFLKTSLFAIMKQTEPTSL